MKHKEWLDRLLSILYPPRCVCCGAVLPTGERLCETCSERIARIEAPVCLLCGQSLQDCSRKHPKTAYKEDHSPVFLLPGRGKSPSCGQAPYVIKCNCRYVG